MDPVVLVLSYGATITPLEIVESNKYLPKNQKRIILSRASSLSQDVIKTLFGAQRNWLKDTKVSFKPNILAEMKQPKELNSTECNLNCYKCAIKTKYYNTSVNLIPFTGKLESVPEDILQTTEALIIYFDPKDTSFIDTIPNTLSKNEQIQLGFLLTTSSSGGEGGMSFGELKERTNFFFDIITLRKGNTPESDSDETDNEYEEVVEGLRNVVWSNVTMGSKESKEDISNDELDNQLKDFENLLLTAQSLRNDTSLTREQFLDRAEQFAGIVSAILNDNDSD